MTILETIISGAVQGITEFLPVSSSGHLVLLHFFFGVKEPQIFFDLFLHLGTLSAVIIYFARDILEIITKKRGELGLIILGTIPLFFLAFLLKSFAAADQFLKQVFISPFLVGVMLMITGLWLCLPKIISKILNKAKINSETEIRGWQAIIVGVAQTLAVLPGISRSGATISTGLILGLEPKQAARFSFLLSIPAVLGGTVFELGDISCQIGLNYFLSLIPGFLIALILGYGAIHILLKIVYAGKFYFFGCYCLLIGLVAVLAAVFS